ncbi:DUF2946 family protein [Sphingomonas pituitosa]|uniref:DUF2946 family protein n=1 Tax=Sphingomonas pituitosa TaxID=99597 RepID=UPI00082A34D7|nr:DUF2946 family protein [Sphingomonas pituitosa]
MFALRRLLLEHRLLCGWLIAAALLMKAVLPAGFMPVHAGGTLVLGFCSGYGPKTIAVGIPEREDRSSPDEHRAAGEMPCAFAGLAMPGLAAVDPALLVLAIAFVLERAIRTAAAILTIARVYLRPPLRGPPRAA